MPVIAVVNRKGGSGKSTFAAHLAAWCARRGHAVMLGDVDRQQSSRGWLRRRPGRLPVISPWALDNRNMLRVPTGISHAILDTPGGLHGFELARIVMFADAIVVPVCPSMFDRESAEQCHAELMTLPRVAHGRCRLAAVGMRVDGRTRAGDMLREWSAGLGLHFLGSLRETQLYERSLEKGFTLFDLPAGQAGVDLAQWQPILDWLQPVLEPPAAANDAVPGINGSRPACLKPTHDALAPGSKSPVLPGAKALQASPQPALQRTAAAGASRVLSQLLKR